MDVVLIGKGILEIVPVITVMTGSVKSIFNTLDSLTMNRTNNYNDSNVINFINDLDIKAKLDAYNLLISEFPLSKSPAITNSLINVKNSILQIENKLILIESKVTYNKSLWVLPSMRAYSLTQDLKHLERLCKTFDNRIKAWKNILEIVQLCNDDLFEKTQEGKFIIENNNHFK